MARQYSFSVKQDIQPHLDNTLGYVKSRRHKDDLMKKKNVRIMDNSELPKNIKQSMSKDTEEYKYRKRKGENIKFYA